MIILIALVIAVVYILNIGGVRVRMQADYPAEIPTQIENLEKYDVIFVGFPTWWYDLPQIMYSFFEEYDFSGKTIIPFNSANGSQFSGTIGTIKGKNQEMIKCTIC